MIDGYGREIDYLRISVTDRCNLRCGYCMPKDGVENIIHPEILSFEEIARIVRVMAGLGVRRVRITGGEPLVRCGITELVRMLCNIDGIDEIAMTSNGILLPGMAKELKEAGLSGVNISLDTLKQDVFKEITGYDGLDEVLRGIDASLEAGLKVKINCVPLIGQNDKDIEEIAGIAKGRPVSVRFIELMPIGCGTGFNGVSSDDIIKRLESRFGASEAEGSLDGRHIDGPAVYYRFQTFMGRVGFISPISHKFCGSCNRIRLTSDGFLKLCLQYPEGMDLKVSIRGGCTDEELSAMISEAVKEKPLSHSFADTTGDRTGEKADVTGHMEQRKMVQIGG